MKKWEERVRSQKGLGEEKEDLHSSAAWIAVVPGPSNPIPANQAHPTAHPVSCCVSLSTQDPPAPAAFEMLMAA